jgi:endogenous inhibitor of DNA gyrase (YacG/DUF329 family)
MTIDTILQTVLNDGHYMVETGRCPVCGTIVDFFEDEHNYMMRCKTCHKEIGWSKEGPWATQ